MAHAPAISGRQVSTSAGNPSSAGDQSSGGHGGAGAAGDSALVAVTRREGTSG